MTSLKVLYFAAFLAYGLLLPFLPPVLRSQGLTDAANSMVMSAVGIAALFSPLLVAHFADRQWKVKWLLTAAFVGASVLAPLWLLGGSNYWHFLVTFVFFSCYLPALSLLDAHTLALLGDEARHQFQKIRIYGSFGFIFPSIVCALVAPSNAALEIFFVVGVSCGTLFAALCAAMLVSCPKNPQIAGTPSFEALKSTLKLPLVAVLWPAAVAMFGLAIFYNTYPRHLQEIGVEPGALGLIFNLGVVAEIALMSFTGRLIQRFGAERIVLAAILAVATRTVLLSLSDSLVVAVATQLLHGPIVVGLFVVLPILLRERAQEGTRYSMQAIQTFLFMGVARSVGPWLASAALLIGAGMGGHTLDRAFLLAACLAIAGFGLSLSLSRKRAE